jgi:hypothetical protein
MAFPAPEIGHKRNRHRLFKAVLYPSAGLASATHESSRTTKLYDRRADEISLGEMEKISI